MGTSLQEITKENEIGIGDRAFSAFGVSPEFFFLRIFSKTCDHEEADTGLLVHVIDLLNAGCSTCLVRTVDTDVVVILVGKFHHLLALNLSAKIGWPLVREKNFAYLDINSISCALGEQIFFGLTSIS